MTARMWRGRPFNRRSFIFNCQTAMSQRAAALFLCGAGYAVVLFVSPLKDEGDGAPRGAAIVIVCPQSLSEPRGAARRAIRTGLRTSGFICGVFPPAPGRAFRGRP